MLVTYNRLGVHNANGVTLKPGVNVVNSVDWKLARQHPMVQWDIDNSYIIEEQDLADISLMTATEETEADTNILNAMKVPQAKLLIEQTTDVALLERWKATERRAQLVGAIKRQIEVMGAPATERDRTQTRQIHTGRGTITMEVNNPEDYES